MSKKILIPFPKNSLPEILNGLSLNNEIFYISKKIELPLKLNLNAFPGLFLFFILLPLLRIAYFSYLLYLKKKKGINRILCLNWNEKILLTPIARLLKIRTIWIEAPEINFIAAKGLLFSSYKRNSKNAKIITFNNLAKQHLVQKGIKEDGIKTMQPALKKDGRERQGNIFSGMAQNGSQFNKKFFVVGTFSDLDKEQNLENLFRSIKICSEIVPNIQLIVVGEGEERKNLTWLAKKMDMENLVWFVGEESRARKWLDNFDIFVVSKKVFKLPDLEIILKSMAAGLPVIGPENSGLDEIIFDGRTGYLANPADSEDFAGKIIKLAQDERLRAKLGQIAKEKVEELFTPEKQLEELENIL